LFCTGVKLGLRGGSNKRLKTLQNGELLFSSPNITRVIKLRRMTKARYMACIAVRCIHDVGEKA